MRKLPQSPRSRKTKPDELGRRVFLQRLTFWGGGGFVLLGQACKPKAEPPQDTVKPKWMGKVLTSSHQTFTDAEYTVVAAVVERILPKDKDPGAVEAGVPVYIDRMLVSPELHEMKEVFVGGITALAKRAETSFKKPFVELEPAQQDKLLAEFRDAPDGSGKQHFFETLMILTMEGFLGDPSYGGNIGNAGWTLVGFDTWMPPHYMPGHIHGHKP